MRRTAVFAYGLICYAIFFGTFLYAIGFMSGVGVPKSIDGGATGSAPLAIAIDALLLSLFAVQHSGMARRAFKRWWTGFIGPAAERSTYVLFSSLALIVLFWQWRPLPAAVWSVENPAGRELLWGICALGWLTVLFGTFMISHTHLFGVAQVWARLRGREQPEPRFQTRWLYKYVRHPLMLGFIIAFWAAPVMTVGHLVFAAGATGYILVATLALEEPDLLRFLGEPYRRYRQRVPAFIPHIGDGVTTDELVEPADEATA
jgi:protein-S-isoprenylcysteine O-methyltransferase Ste14